MKKIPDFIQNGLIKYVTVTFKLTFYSGPNPFSTLSILQAFFSFESFRFLLVKFIVDNQPRPITSCPIFGT